MRRATLTAVVVLALLVAGGASAFVLGRTIWLRPGHCRKVHGQKVCARNVKLKTVTVTPSPLGQTFSGNGGKTLNPLTLSHGVTVHWTSQADADGNNLFSVTSSASDTNFVAFDNGNSSTSGTSYIPAGTYTFNVSATGAWTISF